MSLSQSGSDSEISHITRSVLRRKRRLTRTNKLISSSESESEASITSEELKLCDSYIQPTDGENQTVGSKLTESILILLPVVLARWRAAPLSQYIQLADLLGLICGVTLLPYFYLKGFSHIIFYKFALPMVVSLTSQPCDVPLNLLITLTAVPIPSLLRPGLILLFQQHLEINDPIFLGWCVEGFMKNLCFIIKWLCDGSLTETEVWLFAALATNIILADSISSVGSYIQSLTLACFLTFVPLIPLFEKIIKFSNRANTRRKSKEKIKMTTAKQIYFLAPIIGLFMTYIILLQHGQSLYGLFLYIFTLEHMKILAYWVCILAFVIPLVLLTSKSWTLDFRRKVWHACIVLMFLPVGVNFDAEFTALSISIAFILFIVLEIVRATALPPLGVAIHRTLENFTDERDNCGPIIVSHIFLLLGIGLPIILDHSPAGIICLGLGDASASVIGRLFGRLHLFGNKKTLEGTIAFALGSITGLAACKYIIPNYEQFSKLSLAGMLVTSISTALLEATSGMNDNVIVPIYMMVILKLSVGSDK